MSAPLIFINHHNHAIKDGELDASEELHQRLGTLIEANEPRLLDLYTYTNDDRTE